MSRSHIAFLHMNLVAAVVERFQELKRFNDMCHKLHCSLQFDVTHLKANLQQSMPA